MNDMQDIMNNILAATAVVGIFAGILVEGIKRAEVFSPRSLPLVSLVIGMVTGVALAIGFNQDLATFVAAGFIGGAMASGLYDAISNLIKGVK